MARVISYPAAPIQLALSDVTPADRAETTAILGRLGDPDRCSSG